MDDPLRNTPVPLVEEHYHIRALISAQEKRASDRTYHRDRQKEKEERQKSIDDAKIFVHTDFHCERCNKDFKQNAMLVVEQDWSSPDQFVAYYRGKHRTCDIWSTRLITDKLKDKYWYRSKAVQIDRGSHFADLVQPHEENFNLLYGKR